jgi:prefoldin subunit 5
MAGRVELSESGIRILDLSISNKDSVAFLARIDEADRVSVVQKAVEVGLFCLERGQNAGDVEFVRRQVTGILTSVETAVGNIPGQTKDALLAKIGTEDGQVLAPVRIVVSQATAATQQRIQEVKDLLANDLDPSKSTTVLGRALSALRDLLDPQRTDSVQSTIGNAVNQVVQPNGSLANAVKDSVAEAIGPLKEKVDALTRELHGQEMVEEALSETTAKGATYEDEVAVALQQWAKLSGNFVEQVGPDNQPGDFVVVVNEEWATSGPFRIVIEARDRQSPYGRQKISQDLEAKFQERQAHAAVYVSKTLSGLAKEVGDWAEGQGNSGPWVACSGENLLTAPRFLVVQQKLRQIKQSQPEVDAGAIQAQTDAIRTCLGRIKTIKTRVTNVKATAADIETESESLRKEISDSLSAIEEALQRAGKPPSSASVESGELAAQVS